MRRPLPTATGAWWLPSNVTLDRYYFDARFAAAVVGLTRRANASRVLDVGAGVGKYVRFYRDHGLGADGLDGLSDAHNRSGGLVRQVDLATDGAWCDPHDVVVCMEVLEHIPEAYEAHVIERLACAAIRRLVLSWAGPHQPGNGHVNLRNQSYVRAAFAAHGLLVRENDTAALRAVSTLPWYRTNALVFARDLA